MVDPVTLASGAFAGFQMLRKGLSAGKEIADFKGELNSILDYISGVEEAKRSGKKSNPLNDYIEYERAKQLQKDLEEVIWSCKGSKGVKMYKQFVARAEKSQREGRYKAIKRKNDIIQAVSIGFGIIFFISGAIGLVYFAIRFR